MLAKAIANAARQHEGQLDKAGKPYILHPLHVMANMRTDEEMVVAVLHDVLEDTNTTWSALAMVFDEKVADSVQLLSRNDGEEYDDYIQRIAESNDVVAKKVKLYDLVHNSDLGRIPNVTKADHHRAAKYSRAWNIIEATMPDGWAS